jgi:hypothetical protein
MEKVLQRKLEFNEVIHHTDEDRSNNNLENLKLMSRSDHSSLHSKGAKNPVYGRGGTFKGMKHTQEFKSRLCIRMTGGNNPMFGKIVSEETRKKIGLSSKERPRTEYEREKRSNMMRGSGNPMFGKVASEETRRKMSISHNSRFGWCELTGEIKTHLLEDYIPRRFGVSKLSKKYNCSPKAIIKFLKSVL